MCTWRMVYYGQTITHFSYLHKDKEGYQHRRCYRGCVILLGLVWFTPESVIKEPNQIMMQSQLSLVEDLSAHSLPNLTKPNMLKHQC